MDFNREDTLPRRHLFSVGDEQARLIDPLSDGWTPGSPPPFAATMLRVFEDGSSIARPNDIATIAPPMPEPITVLIRRLDHARDLPMPTRQTAEAAGFDLVAACEHGIEIPAGRIAMIPCGFAMQLPPGYEAQVRPRSGLSSKHGITLVNCVGTIDSDYRGEVIVPLINLSQRPYAVRRGDRIAQMIVMPVPPVTMLEVDQLDDSARGTGGFGHTGSSHLDASTTRP